VSESPWRGGRPGKRDLLAAAGLAAATLALFSEALLGGRVFFQRDIHAYWYPVVESFVRVVSEGAWPVWNPWQSFGAPMLADPSYQVAYPLTWLNLVLLPATVFKLHATLHTLLTGAGAYLLARGLGLGRLAALTGALVWMSAGPLLSLVSMPHHFASAAWMPWVLLALERALTRGTVGSSLLLGAAGAGQLLAGSADQAFFTALMGMARGGAHLLAGPGPTARRVGTVLRVGAVSVCFASALAAVQWVPTLSFLFEGQRLGTSTWGNLYWSLHPASLLDVLVPRLVSSLPLKTEARALLFESREPLLNCLHLGVPSALLALLALLEGRRRALLAAAGLAFFSLAALGRYTPLLVLILELEVPPFGLFRYPTKYLVPAALLWALLTAFGVEAWLGSTGPRARRRLASLASVAVLLAAAAVFAAAWLHRQPQLLVSFLEPEGSAAAAGSAAAKLVTAGGLFLAAAALMAARRLCPCAPVWLGGALLVLVAGDMILPGRGVNVGWEPEWVWALGLQERFVPPAGARWGLGGSYQGDMTGLAPPHLSILTQGTLWRQGSRLALSLLRMGAVDHVIALHRPSTAGLEEVATFPSVYASPIRLLRVQDPLPRCYVLDRARFASGREAFFLVADPAFDPHRERPGLRPSPRGPAG